MHESFYRKYLNKKKLVTMTMTKFILEIRTYFEAYKIYIYIYIYKYYNNYSKNKQHNDEHQYHNFFHATLCILNINMTCVDTCILVV